MKINSILLTILLEKNRPGMKQRNDCFLSTHYNLVYILFCKKIILLLNFNYTQIRARAYNYT